MSVPLKPVGARVIVEQKQAEQQTAFGLVIPTTAQEAPQEGTIVAVGNDPKTADVAVGDRVVFSKYGGATITVDGKSYIVMNIEDVLVVLH